MILGGLDALGTVDETRRTPALFVRRLDFHTGKPLYAGLGLQVPFRSMSSDEVELSLNFGASNGGDEVLPDILPFAIGSKDA